MEDRVVVELMKVGLEELELEVFWIFLYLNETFTRTEE